MKVFTFQYAVAAAGVLVIALFWFAPTWLMLLSLGLAVSWMIVTSSGRQIWSMAAVGASTIRQRLGTSAVVIVSNAGVVGVLVAVLAMGSGFEKTLKRSGSDDTAIVLQIGARNEVGSTIDHATAALVAQSDQVARDDQSRPIASAEQVLSVSLPRKNTGLEASATLRGVGAQVRQLWPQMKITSGRAIASGLHELMVGQGAHEKFSGLDIGSRVTFDGQPWTVVGLFDSGDVHNSEIWGDTEVLGSAYRRGGTVNSVVVRLTSGITAFQAQLRRDPRLKVTAQTTRHYYNQESEDISRMIRTIGAAIGLIMAMGAIFGALNATYMAIASRSREIATLRAIGFARIPVIASVLVETLTLALAGGLLGAALTWAIFDGFTSATMGSTGQIVFAFDVSADLMWSGLKWALAIGIVGGLLPAARVVRHPIATGLRAH